MNEQVEFVTVNREQELKMRARITSATAMTDSFAFIISILMFNVFNMRMQKFCPVRDFFQTAIPLQVYYQEIPRLLPLLIQ